MLKKDNTIILFNKKQVRRYWDEEQELWYFSVVDVMEVLTESLRLRKYWNAFKRKLEEEGSQLSQKLGQLKMEAQGGKIAGNTRKEIETETGEAVASSKSAKQLQNKMVKKLI